MVAPHRRTWGRQRVGRKSRRTAGGRSRGKKIGSNKVNEVFLIVLGYLLVYVEKLGQIGNLFILLNSENKRGVLGV